MDIKKPLGPWACTVSLGGGTTPKPPQCKVGNYSLYKNACWKGIFPKTVTADTAGDCCAASASGKYSKFTYFAQNKVRATLSLVSLFIHSFFTTANASTICPIINYCSSYTKHCTPLSFDHRIPPQWCTSFSFYRIPRTAHRQTHCTLFTVHHIFTTLTTPLFTAVIHHRTAADLKPIPSRPRHIYSPYRMSALTRCTHHHHHHHHCYHYHYPPHHHPRPRRRASCTSWHLCRRRARVARSGTRTIRRPRAIARACTRPWDGRT